MVHDIDDCMAHGIDRCDAFVVFVTRKYVEKINRAASNPLERDNCYKEFSYAQSTCKALIPVVFEPCMRSIRQWPNGIVKMHLGSKLFVDAAENGPQDVAFEISRMIRRSSHIIQPCDMLRKCNIRPTRTAPVLSEQKSFSDCGVQTITHHGKFNRCPLLQTLLPFSHSGARLTCHQTSNIKPLSRFSGIPPILRRSSGRFQDILMEDTRRLRRSPVAFY